MKTSAVAVVSIAALLMTLAPQVSAQIMEGDHLIIGGLGAMARTDLPLDVTKGVNFQIDGVPDDLPNGRPSTQDAILWTLQYYYHPLRHWGIGLSVGGNSMKASPPDARQVMANANAVLLGNADIKATSLELLPVVRYVIFPEHRINPYVLGGVGVNYFSSDSHVTGTFNDGLGNYFLGSYSHTQSSVGLALMAGVGAQITLYRHFLAGLEGRYTYLQTNRNALGYGYWHETAGYVWLGYKWSAPL